VIRRENKKEILTPSSLSMGSYSNLELRSVRMPLHDRCARQKHFVRFPFREVVQVELFSINILYLEGVAGDGCELQLWLHI
jgi:hypothetical protein